MYGWAHNCLKESLLALCGESKWREICEKAGLDVNAAVQKDTYVDDERYFALVDAALEMLPHMTSQDLYDLYGDHFILYLENNGYDTYLHTFGDTLFDLLNNMNRLHSHLACSMDKMKVPNISCQECAGKDSKDCFTLRYSSPRGARLKGMLVGLVKSLARQYFQSTVKLTELTNEIDQTTSNPMTIWEVQQVYNISRSSSVCSFSSALTSPYHPRQTADSLSLSTDQFHLLAPCHVIFDKEFEILEMTSSMTPQNTSTLPQEEGKGNLSDWFRVSAPGIEGVSGMEWDTFQTAALVTSEKGQSFYFETKKCFTKSGKPLSYVGKIVFLKNGLGEDHAAVFLCSPNVDTLEQMYDQGVSVQDLKGRDDCRLQMLLNQANLDHFQSSSSEAIEKLDEEVLASTKARGDLDAKRRLMMYISHEIRTPLSIARFGFQLIKNQLLKLNEICEEDTSAGRICNPMLASTPTLASTLPPPNCNKSKASLDPNNNLHGTNDSENILRSTLGELDSITSDSAHSVEVAISILNDFLSYEKLQADVLEMFKDFTPCGVLKSVIDEFSVEASYFKVNLSFESKLSSDDQLEDIFMYADKQKIAQVVRNFVSNSLKFTPEGGLVSVSIDFQPIEDDSREPDVKTSKVGQEYIEFGVLQLVVEDTGAGIAKENHDRVFNEMVQFNPNELQGGGGSGLGLFISRAIIHKHDGTVGFESEGLGCGCKFFFNIPAYCMLPTNSFSTLAVSSSPQPLFPSTLSSPLAGRTVLLCDDSALIRKMLRKVLMGFDVQCCLEANDGLEAVKIVEEYLLSTASNDKTGIDIILLDDHMPGLRGPEVVRRIRDLGFDNPIIGVTGSNACEDVDNFLASGADTVLHKPLEISKLIIFLRQIELLK